ncbi:unnamed protein product [Adineta ricciae]|uniref:Uncharacterized protein n=1 Tax=Adineta ricciae TaxID=249248 RepID=A0A816B5W9_ADIRI|nr:unnamed protein product [Adineta ricciae]
MDSLRLKVQFVDEAANSERLETEFTLKFIYRLQHASRKTIGDLIKELEKQTNQELKSWLKIKEYDVSDNCEKYVHIELNQFSKLYVQLRAINNDYGSQLFDIRELIEIATQKSRDTSICRLTNDSDDSPGPSSITWLIECL